MALPINARKYVPIVSFAGNPLLLALWEKTKTYVCYEKIKFHLACLLEMRNCVLLVPCLVLWFGTSALMEAWGTLQTNGKWSIGEDECQCEGILG